MIWQLKLLVTLGALACAPSERIPVLPSSGDTLAMELSDGEHRIYQTKLSRGEVLRLKVRQDGVDVVLRAFGPGQQEWRFDSDNAFDGPEWLIVQADRSGSYSIDIEGIATSQVAGPKRAYLTVETRGVPAPADEVLLDALRVLKAAGQGHSSEEIVAELMGLRQNADSNLPGLIRARLAYRLGTIHRFSGKPVEAATFLAEADDGFERFGNAWERTSTLNHLAFVQIRLGRLADAEKALLLSQELGAQTEQPRTRASTWSLWGILHATRGSHSSALRAHRRAEELFEKAGDAKGLADCRQNIGSQLLLLGAVDEGLGVLREAVDLWRALERPLDLGRALLTQSWGLKLRSALYDDPEDLEQALDLSDQAIEHFSALSAPWDLALGLEHRGALLALVDRPKDALEDLQRSAELIDPEADHMHPHWVGLAMGQVWGRSGEVEKSARHLDRALAGFEELGHVDGQVACHLELARLDRSIGRREAAAGRLNRAIEILEKPRDSLRTEEFRRSYLALHQDVYAELVDLWADAAWSEDNTSGRAREWALTAVEATERGKARGLRDRLSASHRPLDPVEVGEDLRVALDALEARLVLPASVEEGFRRLERGAGDPDPGDHAAVARSRMEWLQTRESDTAVLAGSRSEPFSASSVDSLIDEDTAFLLYALGQRRSWAFLMTSGEIRVHRLKPRREIHDAARRAHTLLPRWDTPGSKTAAKRSLDDLAALILEPLGLLPDVERLVVVPSGALHLVPFAALPAPDGRPLIARGKVVHLPSLAVLEQIRTSRREAGRGGSPDRMAVVVDPVFGRGDPRLPERIRSTRTRGERDLARLVATQAEADHILESVARQNVDVALTSYRGFKAEADLLRHGTLAQTRFLHIATHGLVDSQDPSVAGLVFSLFDDEGRPQNGFLPVRDLYRIELRADLVVLSACRTGTGREVRGEGVVGLSHGFFAAGARHLVVSFWDVEDRATAELIKRFYDHLFSGEPEPDQALWAAQNEMREHPLWSSPRHWAGFISNGDWER